MAKVIIGDRQIGKTTEIIKDSARLKAPILCARKGDIDAIVDRAHQLSVDIPDPILFVSKNSLRGHEFPNGVIIDDVDLFLQRIIGLNVSIEEVGLTLDALRDTKLLTKEDILRKEFARDMETANTEEWKCLKIQH